MKLNTISTLRRKYVYDDTVNVLVRTFTAHLWDHRHDNRDHKQPGPCQPDGREDADTLNQDACQCQPQRAHRAWKKAAGAHHSAFEFVRNQFQAMAELPT